MIGISKNNISIDVCAHINRKPLPLTRLPHSLLSKTCYFTSSPKTYNCFRYVLKNKQDKEKNNIPRDRFLLLLFLVLHSYIIGLESEPLRLEVKWLSIPIYSKQKKGSVFLLVPEIMSCTKKKTTFQ